MEVWLVTSTDEQGRVTSTVFARHAKQQAIDYACQMDAEGWKSHVQLHLVLSVLPVTVRHEMASISVHPTTFDRIAKRLA